MTNKLKATTRRMIPVLAQIVQRYLPGHKIEELAKDEVVKAREFSYSAQVYLLMLGQLAHVFSLNELVDLSSIFSGAFLGVWLLVQENILSLSSLRGNIQSEKCIDQLRP